MAGTVTERLRLQGVNGRAIVGTVASSTGLIDVNHGLGTVLGVVLTPYTTTTDAASLGYYETIPATGAITVVSSTTAASYTYMIVGV